MKAKSNKKLTLKKVTIRDLSAKKGKNVRGGDYNTGSNTEQCTVLSTSECAHKLQA